MCLIVMKTIPKEDCERRWVDKIGQYLSGLKGSVIYCLRGQYSFWIVPLENMVEKRRIKRESKKKKV